MLFLSRRIAGMLQRSAPQKDFPPVAAEDGLIFLEDTESRSYIGATLVGMPMVGLGSQTFSQLESVVSGNFPPDTFVQIEQLSVPDINEYAEDWLSPKAQACQHSPVISESQREPLLSIAVQQAEHFIMGKGVPHIRSTGMRLHRIIQSASIKIPVSPEPTDAEIETARDCIEKFEAGLATAGMPVHRATAGEYLGVLRLRFDPYQRQENWYDDLRELREQVLPPGFTIDYTQSNELRLGKTFARILSPKRFPRRMWAGLMRMLHGDPKGIDNQLPIPWAMTLTIRLPDRQKKRKWFEGKFSALTFFANQGHVTRWVPRVAMKKADADILKSEVENGKHLGESCFTMTLYSSDQRELHRMSTQVQTYAAGYDFELVEDTEILWPLFWNTLPLFPSDTSIQRLNRFWSMSIRQGLLAIPASAEWTGMGSGSTVMLETRMGLPFGFDLYRSPNNYNGLVFAQPGGGKSTLLQLIILNYLEEGARVWVVDIGRSYYKLCKIVGGEFWSFGEDSKVCLNPFTNIEDIDDAMDLLVALIAKMAAPLDGLDDYQRARVQEAIKAVWSNKATSMTISDVAQYMAYSEDQRVQDMATMLHPFTNQGQYGHWFEGVNNLRFDSNFVVLELEELSQKPVLQQVVLMTLMAKIQHDMFLGQDDGVKKISIWDEAWALFSDPGVAKFLNHAVRRFRKYRGSCLLAVHGIADFFLNPEMEAIADNCETKLILNQQAEVIDRAVNSGRLTLDEWGISQLKTVHTVPDSYSEVMIVNGQTYSIARVVLSRFLQVLFSTRGEARNLIMQQVENGVPAHRAIEDFIAERG